MAGGVGPFQGLLDGGGGAFNFFLVGGGDFAGVVLEHFFAAINGVLRLVARLDFLAFLPVFLGVHFAILAHSFDLRPWTIRCWR